MRFVRDYVSARGFFQSKKGKLYLKQLIELKNIVVSLQEKEAFSNVVEQYEDLIEDIEIEMDNIKAHSVADEAIVNKRKKSAKDYIELGLLSR